MIWSILAGAALLLAVTADVMATVVVPRARGPLSVRLFRVAWHLIRHAPGPVRTRLTPHAGPASILATIAMWLVGLWAGYGLIYLPFVAGLAYSPTVRFGTPGPFDALYLSGVSLTSLGFGDVVAQTNPLRLVTILEAVSGLGLATASISYLPVIYTMTGDRRSAAQAAADLDADHPLGAAAVVVHGGLPVAEALRRDLATAHQQIVRFPVLIIFHATAEESPLGLLRCAAGVCVTLQWGLDHDRAPYARQWGPALERALRRLLKQTARELPGALDRVVPDQAAATATVTAVRAAVRALDPALAAVGPVPPAAAELLGLAETAIGGYAAMHGFPHQPVLAGPAGPAG